MPLLIATGAFGLERRHYISPQGYYLNRLCTVPTLYGIHTSNTCRKTPYHQMLKHMKAWMRQSVSSNFFCSNGTYLIGWKSTQGCWVTMPSVLWCCWLGGKKGIQPVKTEWWGTSVVICLERGANDLHMVQLMPLSPPSSLAPVKSRKVYLSGAGLPRSSWKKAVKRT